ncbi:unnamed protein product [Polarella glacialis]|uniref:Uncharacterized protein n=1 Tax=Polarella glacialis TaxID=89957 RepID=A0A813J7U8_POLGL|nr:unnamed protein product [Polarella glacialis]
MGNTLGQVATQICTPSASEPKRPSETHGSTAAESYFHPLKAAQPAAELEAAPTPAASMMSMVMLPGISWASLLLLDAYLPILASGRVWSLICCVIFWLWMRMPSPAPASSTREPERFGVAKLPDADIEEVLADLVQQLDGSKPPAEAEELKVGGWQDLSQPGATVFLKMVKTPKMTSRVSIKVQTRDQANEFHLVKMDRGRLAGGAVLIFTAIEHWPLWFPFCQSTQKLAQVSPTSSIHLVKFKILFLTIDLVLLVSFANRLDASGSIDIMFKTPLNGLKNRTWLGIPVPKPSAALRQVVTCMRLSLVPKTLDSGVIVFQAETKDEVQIPWVSKLFWQACSTRIIGLIMGMQDRFDGSVLDAHFNAVSEEASQRRALMSELHDDIIKHCASL